MARSTVSAAWRRRSHPALWAVLALVGFAIAAVPSALVTLSLAQPFSMTSLPQALVGAAWSALAVVAGTQLARLLRVYTSSDAHGWRLATSAVVICAWTFFSFGVWAVARYGSMDPDLLKEGLAIPILAAAAVSFAAMRPWLTAAAARWTLALATLSCALLAVLGAMNVPGVADGVSSEGWLLLVSAVLVALIVLWAGRYAPAEA